MKSALLYQGKHLEFRRRRGWEYVEHRIAKESVMVVALTSDERIVLVEEFRPAVNASVICLPAGLVGDEGQEDSESAARRELSEETGGKCRGSSFWGAVPARPGCRRRSSSFTRRAT